MKQSATRVIAAAAVLGIAAAGLTACEGDGVDTTSTTSGTVTTTVQPGDVVRSSANKVTEEAKKGADDASEKVKENANKATNKVKEGANKAKDEAGSAWDKVKDEASDATEKVKEEAGNAKDKVVPTKTVTQTVRR